MTLYLKIVATGLIAVILGMTTGRDFTLLLSICVCILGAFLLLELLEPVIALLQQLQLTAKLSGETGKILLKVTAVGLLSEIASVLCADAGNGSVSKMLKLTASGMILYLAVPLVQSVLDVLGQLLEVL